MYSSLEKLDFACAYPDDDGGSIAYFIQTDHRNAASITATASLSVIFAITRCFRAHEAAVASGRTPFRVVYTLDCAPPPFLSYVVEAAGGAIAPTVDRDTRMPEAAPRASELATLIGDASQRLADEVWRASRLDPSFAGLVAYERTMVRPGRGDEVGFYTAAVTLATLAASVLQRALEEPKWRHAPTALVPFVFSGRRAGRDYLHIDVFSRAKRFVEHGSDDALSALVLAMIGDGT